MCGDVKILNWLLSKDQLELQGLGLGNLGGMKEVKSSPFLRLPLFSLTQFYFSDMTENNQKAQY